MLSTSKSTLTVLLWLSLQLSKGLVQATPEAHCHLVYVAEEDDFKYICTVLTDAPTLAPTTVAGVSEDGDTNQPTVVLPVVNPNCPPTNPPTVLSALETTNPDEQDTSAPTMPFQEQTNPTAAPTFASTYIGEPEDVDGLGQCEGRCASDDDCMEGLVCFIKTPDNLFDNPGGCSMSGYVTMNYCYLPEPVDATSETPSTAPILSNSTAMPTADSAPPEEQDQTAAPSQGLVEDIQTSVPSTAPVALITTAMPTTDSAIPGDPSGTSSPTRGFGLDVETSSPTASVHVATSSPSESSDPSGTDSPTPGFGLDDETLLPTANDIASSSPSELSDPSGTSPPTPGFGLNNETSSPTASDIASSSPSELSDPSGTSPPTPGFGLDNETSSPTASDIASSSPSESSETLAPSLVSSNAPSILSSSSPTLTASTTPSMSSAPTLLGSNSPSTSFAPVSSPSAAPTSIPSLEPTALRSLLPTTLPSLSFLPSLNPSGIPSRLPTLPPTFGPTTSPSTSSPTSFPTPECGENGPARFLAMQDSLVSAALSRGYDLSFNDTTSASALAFEWVAQTDVLHLCPDSSNLVQRFVLALLYFSLGGENWNECTIQFCSGSSFLSGLEECSWDGIVCTNDEIVEIHLNDRNVVGPLPELVGLLSSLQVLSVDDNRISGSIPESLGTLANLRVIDLDNNELTGTIPDALFNATMLQVIDLDTNRLEGTLSSRFGELEDLYFLQLDKNYFQGDIPEELGTLADLKYLSLFLNNFNSSIPSALCGDQRQIFADCDVCTIADCCQACLR